jgi:threonine/homoserine efflux transporter RhtA
VKLFLANQKVYDFLIYIRTTKASARLRRDLAQAKSFLIIIAKSVLGRITPLTVSTIICIFAALLFLPISFYEAVSFDFSRVTLVEWQYVAYYGIVVTVLAFVLMYQGLSKVPASTAGVLTGVLPLSAVVLSYVILRVFVVTFNRTGLCSFIYCDYSKGHKRYNRRDVYIITVASKI